MYYQLLHYQHHCPTINSNKKQNQDRTRLHLHLPLLILLPLLTAIIAKHQRPYAMMFSTVVGTGHNDNAIIFALHQRLDVASRLPLHVSVIYHQDLRVHLCGRASAQFRALCVSIFPGFENSIQTLHQRTRP